MQNSIRITLMDGNQIDIPREEALELLPYRHVLSNPNLKSPVDGVFCHRGKVVPVLGPLPVEPFAKSIDGRPWLLLMKGCAQAIQGLPEFEERAPSNVVPLRAEQDEESQLLDELDDLLKTA